MFLFLKYYYIIILLLLSLLLLLLLLLLYSGECRNILLSSKRCREVFKHPPIVAYRRTSNFCDMILVKAKLSTITTHNNTSLPPGSFRRGQDCATCPYVTNGLTHYWCNPSN